jgi:hypothetical protein
MSDRDQKQPVGADLIIPVAAAGYAVYYVLSVSDFPFEAQVSGMALAGALVLLVLLYFLRLAIGFRRGVYSLGLGEFFGPRESRPARGVFVALIVAFIVAIPYLGFTLTVFAFLAASFVVAGARPVWRAIALAAAVALAGWLFFIVLLGTRFPQGPFEHAVGAMF